MRLHALALVAGLASGAAAQVSPAPPLKGATDTRADTVTEGDIVRIWSRKLGWNPRDAQVLWKSEDRVGLQVIIAGDVPPQPRDARKPDPIDTLSVAIADVDSMAIDVGSVWRPVAVRPGVLDPVPRLADRLFAGEQLRIWSSAAALEAQEGRVLAVHGDTLGFRLPLDTADRYLARDGIDRLQVRLLGGDPTVEVLRGIGIGELMAAVMLVAEKATCKGFCSAPEIGPWAVTFGIVGGTAGYFRGLHRRRWTDVPLR